MYTIIHFYGVVRFLNATFLPLKDFLICKNAHVFILLLLLLLFDCLLTVHLREDSLNLCTGRPPAGVMIPDAV